MGDDRLIQQVTLPKLSWGTPFWTERGLVVLSGLRTVDGQRTRTEQLQRGVRVDLTTGRISSLTVPHARWLVVPRAGDRVLLVDPADRTHLRLRDWRPGDDPRTFTAQRDGVPGTHADVSPDGRAVATQVRALRLSDLAELGSFPNLGVGALTLDNDHVYLDRGPQDTRPGCSIIACRLDARDDCRVAQNLDVLTSQPAIVR